MVRGQGRRRIVTGGIYDNISRTTIQAGHRNRAIWPFEMASKNTKAPKGIQCPLKAYNWHLPESYFHGVLQKVHPVKFRL